MRNLYICIAALLLLGGCSDLESPAPSTPRVAQSLETESGSYGDNDYTTQMSGRRSFSVALDWWVNTPGTPLEQGEHHGICAFKHIEGVFGDPDDSARIFPDPNGRWTISLVQSAASANANYDPPEVEYTCIEFSEFSNIPTVEVSAGLDAGTVTYADVIATDYVRKDSYDDGDDDCNTIGTWTSHHQHSTRTDYTDRTATIWGGMQGEMSVRGQAGGAQRSCSIGSCGRYVGNDGNWLASRPVGAKCQRNSPGPDDLRGTVYALANGYWRAEDSDDVQDVLSTGTLILPEVDEDFYWNNIFYALFDEPTTISLVQDGEEMDADENFCFLSGFRNERGTGDADADIDIEVYTTAIVGGTAYRVRGSYDLVAIDDEDDISVAVSCIPLDQCDWSVEECD